MPFESVAEPGAMNFLRSDFSGRILKHGVSGSLETSQISGESCSDTKLQGETHGKFNDVFLQILTTSRRH